MSLEAEFIKANRKTRLYAIGYVILTFPVCALLYIGVLDNLLYSFLTAAAVVFMVMLMRMGKDSISAGVKCPSCESNIYNCYFSSKADKTNLNYCPNCGVKL